MCIQHKMGLQMDPKVSNSDCLRGLPTPNSQYSRPYIFQYLVLGLCCFPGSVKEQGALSLHRIKQSFQRSLYKG